MSMTIRERIHSVYNGETPDRVPFMLDLSHYYYDRFHKKWDLLDGYSTPDIELIDFHKQFDAGFYIPNQAVQYRVEHDDSIEVTTTRDERGGVPVITWKYETPLGTLERSRIWEPASYSWAIADWSVKTKQDLKILGYVMASRKFIPMQEACKAWDDAIGDNGIAYLMTGYSAMGYLLNYWMGIENVIYATMDMADELHEFVDQTNENILQCVTMLAEQYDGKIILMGDNFSSNLQPPHFYETWSKPFYKAAVDKFHQHGKKVAVHVDGMLKGSIKMMRETGVDAIDAVTPKPMGDYTAQECRDEAGPDLILSGGVSPDLWLPEVPVEAFKEAAIAWVQLSKQSPALIAAAGDQVPPKACEDRIKIYADIVNQYGQY